MEPKRSNSFQRAIFRVLLPDGTTGGTAFAVADGILVTCSHVVQDSLLASKGRCVVIHHQTGRRYSASVLKRYSRPATGEDISTLRIRKDSAYKHLEFGSYALKAGSTLYSFGFPEPKSIEGMPGRASMLGEAMEAGHPVLALQSSQLSVGFSGAPALDEASDLVVGVVVSVTERDSVGRLGDAAFIVPALTVLSLCPFAKRRAHPELERYCSSIRNQLNRSPYFLPGLPTISLTKTFQAPDLTRMRKNAAEIGHESIGFNHFREAIFTPQHSICVVGDAGCGKSTILRYCALSLAELASDGSSPVPIYVRARSLAAASGLTIAEKIKEALRSDSYYSLDMELADDFLSRWTLSMGIWFVLFVDACDELNDLRERVLFLRYLREDLLPYLSARGHSLTVASRDVGQLEGIKHDFDVFCIGPLRNDAPQHIGKAILGPGPLAEQFPNFLERLTNRHLAQSPLSVLLLLTIYLNLRERREYHGWDLKSVYECYFELTSAELSQRGIDRAVPPDVIAFALEFLQIIAWRDFSGDFNENVAINEFADLLSVQTKRGHYAAEKDALRLFRYLAEDAGIFSVVGNNLTWTHQNFRDYLAACSALAAAASDSHVNIVGLIEDSWNDASQETFARFLVCMSSVKADVLHLATHLMNRQQSFVSFLSRAVADGAVFCPDLLSSLARNLFASASAAFGRCSKIFTPALEDPVEALKLVVWKEPYLSLAIQFIAGKLSFEDLVSPEDFRLELSKALNRTIGGRQLQSLVAAQDVSREISNALLNPII